MERNVEVKTEERRKRFIVVEREITCSRVETIPKMGERGCNGRQPKHNLVRVVSCSNILKRVDF